MIPEFKPFPKIHRFNREVIVTEKLDGTNAQIYVSDDLEDVVAGSRNRWLTVESDNFGFAKWVVENRDTLRELGPGFHFGEWWGAGIQRRYGLAEKRFSLFNVARWGETRPACCHVVPELWRGVLCDFTLAEVLLHLETHGSVAAPGFMKPEGIVMFHEPSRHLYKVTLGDDGHKGGNR